MGSRRPPGGSGLAIVLDTATFADSPGGAHTSSGRDSGAKGRPVGPSASAYAELLHPAGWSGAVARQGDGVPEVWSALTTRGVLVG